MCHFDPKTRFCDFVRFARLKYYYYRPQTKFVKVMFLHLSVSHSVHRGGVSPGPHPGGMLRDLAGGVSRPTPGEGVPRRTPKGGLQAHTQGVLGPGPHLVGCVSQHALRQTPPSPTPPPQQMATAAGSTHPTGMHSSYFL